MSEFSLISSMKESSASPIKKTVVTRIRDSNQGSYAGNQFSLDTRSLISSNDMFALSEAHLEIPYTITVSALADMDKTNFLLALKHGYYSKIAGISVKLDNQALCTYTNLSNLYTHFNVMSTMNESDMKTVGNLIGFHKDESCGYSYNVAQSVNGIGECDTTGNDTSNGLKIDTDLTYKQTRINNGFVKRAEFINYREDDALLAPFVKTGRANEIFKSSVTHTADTKTYNVCAIVRLSDIHDVFKSMPVLRNPNLNLVVQFHSCNTYITVDNTNQYQPGVITNPVNNFCNYQIKPCIAGIIADAGTFGIVETMGNSSRNIVELVIPKIEMNPDDELRYLEDMGNDHLVKYTDIHSNTETFSSPAISWQINSALSAMTGMLLLVRLGSNGAALTGDNAATMSVDHSPFTSCPNYLCSAQAVSNFQVLLSNKPIFEAPVQYNYDMYLDMMRAKSINGFSSNASITSGLITRKDWEESSYGYIYVSLPKSTNMHADQSLQVRFNNDNIAKVQRLDLVAFVEVEKAYEIDVNTGKIKMIQQ